MNAPETKAQSSCEHIIPSALGGGKGLSTNDVCSKCNNELGGGIDAAFLESTIIIMLRHKFGLKSHRKVIPDLKLSAKSIDTGVDTKLIFKPSAEVEVSQRACVESKTVDEDEFISISGLTPDVRKIMNNIIKSKFKDRNANEIRELVDKANKKIDELEKSSTLYDKNGYKAEIIINLKDIYKGMFKIVYEFGHSILGYRWTDSTSGKELKSIIMNDVDIQVMLALMVSPNKEKIENILPLDGLDTVDKHIISLVPIEGNSFIYLSLFGEPFLTFGVRVNIDVNEVYPEDQMDANMLAIVDPRTRSVTWRTILDGAEKLQNMGHFFE